MQHSLVALILLSAAILGLETNPTAMTAFGPWLVAADRTILVIFVVEIGLRLTVQRLSYFRDPWNVFDFVVVSIALVPASGPLAVLRALRVLRVLRLITLVPSMKRVIGGLLSAVIATRIYEAAFPEWFGALGDSAFTLFQVMTLESWAMGIVRPVMSVFPLAWVFFLFFILASTFTLLNLFIAVIVNAIQSEHERATPPSPISENEQLRYEIAELRKQLGRFKTPALAARKRR